MTYTLKCNQCGNKFKVPGSRRKTAKCCSFKCSQKHKARTTVKARADFRRGSGVGYIKLNGEYLHRMIARMISGKRLTRRHIIHHRDGNHRNNDPMNIQVTTRKEHIMLHIKKMLAARRKKCGY